jgi:hypothetical protein
MSSSDLLKLENLKVSFTFEHDSDFLGAITFKDENILDVPVMDIFFSLLGGLRNNIQNQFLYLTSIEKFSLISDSDSFCCESEISKTKKYENEFLLLIEDLYSIWIFYLRLNSLDIMNNISFK